MTIKFSDLGLRPELVQAVEALGYINPTPIQERVTPLLLDGKDVIGQAQTGTGKTAAFALPILNKITESTGDVQALVITPTRELANQVTKSFEEFARFSNIKVLPVYGGQSYGVQKGSLRRGVDVVVGTPGRLLDLIKQGDLNLENTHSVALDEADEMLSMGFVEDIEVILKELPKERQTLLFSATMPNPIRRLADKYMNDAQSVTIERKTLTADNIEQRHYLVNERDRSAAVVRILEMEDFSRIIIFGQTRARTAELANTLNSGGYAAEVLNGDLSQEARERVMTRFRSDQTKILVATDVAARGLDVDDVSHVINFDVPAEVESYVHRIGRTGRAGTSGIAISFMTPRESYKLSRIEKHIKLSIPKATLPTIEEIQQRRNERLQEKMLGKLERGRYKAELEIVEQLVAAGNDPLEVAAAAIKLARAGDEKREIPSISEVTKHSGKSGSSSGRRRNGGGGGRRGPRGDSRRGGGGSSHRGKGRDSRSEGGRSSSRNGKPSSRPSGSKSRSGGGSSGRKRVSS